MKRNGIYVASRASVPERAAMWRGLRANGWPITSTWVDEDGPGQTADLVARVETARREYEARRREQAARHGTLA